MKKLLLATCFTLALGTFSLAATGPSWPFHRHHKDKAATPAAPKAEKPPKTKKSMFHRQKSQDKAREQAAHQEAAAGVSPGPKSVGWRHQTPGPAGAGAK